MIEYLDLLERVRSYGVWRSDRTGTGTFSLFGEHLSVDVSKSFPLLTTKKIFFRSVVHELLWFLKGSDNIKYLKDNNVGIWDAWADDEGNVGPIYGKQWRDCRGVDQLGDVIKEIKVNPSSRRLVVSSWDASRIDDMALPPCHCLFQFYVRDGFLDCHLYQRSADIFLGVPFNIASYALLMHLVGNVCSLVPGMLKISYGDLHIYSNHMSQVNEQLSRMVTRLPTLDIKGNHQDIDSFVEEDIVLMNYSSASYIKAEISV